MTTKHFIRALPVAFLVIACALRSADSAHAPGSPPSAQEVEQALKNFKVPPGFKVELFAAEPMLAQPVAFCMDEKGRFFVSETHRFANGIAGGGDKDFGALDLRGHMDWLDQDLSNRSSEDREAMLRRNMTKERLEQLTKNSEIVRLIEDTDGDGKADRSSVFADGFNQILDGAAAGILARKGNVYFTCIPNLWLLKDTTGTGKADVRKVLQSGFGVRVAFLGHDLHGLVMGPDGKLYFSVGDRGYGITTSDGRKFGQAECGAVFRCYPDGSDFEVFATGLRNPQELVFDQYGNLFTADNNADHGDPARWVYIVEGGDSGWRGGYQFITQPNKLGPWMSEKLCYPHFEGQAAYIVPPVANIGVGPSGIAYWPGTGPEILRDRFLYCDYRGSSGGVLSFGLKPKGAGFELYDQKEFFWRNQATDVLFGNDGAIYASIWYGGIDKTNKGRIYKVSDSATQDPLVLETKKLIADGMDKRGVDELAKLLEHKDQRVRQEAQFALAEKGKDGISAFKNALQSKNQLARIHAVWGLGQIAKKDTSGVDAILPLLADADAEVCAQASKVCGDLRMAPAVDRLIALLKHENLRARSFAAISLGKIADVRALNPLCDLLRENAEKDPWLRHAGMMGLLGIAEKSLDPVFAKATHESASVRLGVLVVLRRLKYAAVGRFIKDADTLIVAEAARAINDVPIPEALPELAAILSTTETKDRAGTVRRAMNANFRLGKPENAAALASFAARENVEVALRAEALAMLLDWATPPVRDRIMNLPRSLDVRDGAPAAEALKPVLPALLKSDSGELQSAAAKLAGKYQLKESATALLELLNNQKATPEARIEALRALAELKDKALFEAVRAALADKQPKLRQEGGAQLAKLNPADAIGVLSKTLENASTPEKQGALAVLAAMKNPAADAIIASWMEKLLAGQVAPELQLDLLEAAKVCGNKTVKERLAAYEKSLPADDELAKFKVSLSGGDVEAGRKIFHEHATAQCIRCHKISGQGGDVGPDLAGIGGKKDRAYILESIIAPSNQIAQGYESTLVNLNDGKVVTGIIKSEDDKQITVVGTDGKAIAIKKEEIKQRRSQKFSTMPPMNEVLTRGDIRNLVEYLFSLK